MYKFFDSEAEMKRTIAEINAEITQPEYLAGWEIADHFTDSVYGPTWDEEGFGVTEARRLMGKTASAKLARNISNLIILYGAI